MKKRSRVLSVLLTATMVVGVAGCGSSDAASDNAGSSAQETVGESTEAADEAETEEDRIAAHSILRRFSL